MSCGGPDSPEDMPMDRSTSPSNVTSMQDSEDHAQAAWLLRRGVDVKDAQALESWTELRQQQDLLLLQNAKAAVKERFHDARSDSSASVGYAKFGEYATEVEEYMESRMKELEAELDAESLACLD
jgi:hypothetical protein